ncbi:MAG: hypothetical protein ACK6CU_15870 [Deltaproteobacteria bacterium]
MAPESIHPSATCSQGPDRRGGLEITLRCGGFFVEGYTTPIFRAVDAGFVGVAGLLLRSS